MRGFLYWLSVFVLKNDSLFVFAEGQYKDEGKSNRLRGLSLQKGGLLSYLHETRPI